MTKFRKRLLFVVEYNGGQHGAEDFFAGDLYVVAHAIEDRRFDKIPARFGKHLIKPELAR